MTKQVALITGSAKRIGREIAIHLHQKGIDVIIHCYQSINEGQILCRQLNDIRAQSAYLIQQDLAEKNAVSNILKKLEEHHLSVHILVNNASIFIKDSASEDSLSHWDNQFLINTRIPYELSLALSPMLKQHQGIIINITDIHAQRPLKDYDVYCQTKAALLMQTKALAKRLSPNIRVNAVAPGAIIWPEYDNQLSAKQQAKIIAKTPLKAHGKPEYIAKAVYSLIDNPFITGETIHVDGGRHL